MIPSCFIAKLRKLDRGELFFLAYRYLWGGVPLFFGDPTLWRSVFFFSFHPSCNGLILFISQCFGTRLRRQNA